MQITIDLPLVDFPQEDLDRLRRVLEARDDNEFSQKMSKVAYASLYELTRMLLGENLPTRADDIRQHRLLHLIKFLYGDRLPTETQISTMFQITASQSKTLLRNAISRFKHQLEGIEHQTLVDYLSRATKVRAREDNSPYRVTIQSDNVVECLNQIIEREAPTFDPVKKVTGSSRLFEVSADAMDVLSGVLGFALPT